MTSVQDGDRRIREMLAQQALAATQPAPVLPAAGDAPAVAAAGDVRQTTALHAGSSPSSVPFVAQTVTLATYGDQDFGHLIEAMTTFQQQQGGTEPPITAETLKKGLELAQSGAVVQLFTAAVDKTMASADVVVAAADQMRPEEVKVVEFNQQGIDVMLDYADGMAAQSEDAMTGDTAPVVVLPVVPAEPSTAAPAPEKNTTGKPAKGKSPAGGASPAKPHVVQCKDRRDVIMTLAADFMGSGYAGGDMAKKVKFEKAVEVAARKGIRLNDPAYKEVVSYLQAVLAHNPRMDKMIVIKDGVLRLKAPRNMFSNYPKVSSAIGLYHVLTKGGDKHAAEVRDAILAVARQPGGVALNDPQYGPILRRALALVKSQPDLFGKDLFVEKNGKLTLSLTAPELQDLQQVFAFLESSTLSAAAMRARDSQKLAVAAIGASIEASETVLVVATVLKAMAAAGVAPLPLAFASDAHGVRAGPAIDAVAEPAPDTPSETPDVQPVHPGAAGTVVEAKTRTVLPPDTSHAGQSHDVAVQDYLTTVRKADEALAQSRSERLRSEARRLADIQSAADQQDHAYDEALDKQARRLRELEQTMPQRP